MGRLNTGKHLELICIEIRLEILKKQLKMPKFWKHYLAKTKLLAIILRKGMGKYGKGKHWLHNVIN